MFYRNANFVRRPLQASTSQTPFSRREIPLAPFDGDIRQYPEFRNGFLEMVGAQRNLEPRQKMQYLLYYLRGTPLQMAEGFPISTEGYFDAIDLLERKYGDKTLLGNTLLQDSSNYRRLR